MVITNRQEVLVYEEKVCEWITYKCLNCSLLCYAKSIIIDEPEILINSDSLVIHKLSNFMYLVSKLVCVRVLLFSIGLLLDWLSHI